MNRHYQYDHKKVVSKQDSDSSFWGCNYPAINFEYKLKEKLTQNGKNKDIKN